MRISQTRITCVSELALYMHVFHVTYSAFIIFAFRKQIYIYMRHKLVLLLVSYIYGTVFHKPVCAFNNVGV